MSDTISNKAGMSLEDRVIWLEQELDAQKSLIRALGKQNADLKTGVNDLKIDITILKQGGNI